MIHPPIAHLHCQLCTWQAQTTEFELLVAAYMFHTIKEHWDMIQKAHDNPEMLDQAMILVAINGVASES